MMLATSMSARALSKNPGVGKGKFYSQLIFTVEGKSPMRGFVLAWALLGEAVLDS